MKRTIITAVTLLLSSNLSAFAQQGPASINQDAIANADVSEMVIQEDLMHLRRLVNATAAAKKKEEAKAAKEDAGEEGDDDSTEGAPDEKSMAGDEEDELQDKQGAPEISEEQQE